MSNRLLAFGLGGTTVAALCCFTPLLPIMLTAVGLGGLVSTLYTDAILLPVLGGFFMLTGYALWRKTARKSA